MKWRRAFYGAAIGVPAIALLGFGMTRDPREIPSPLPGRAAPGFTLSVFTNGLGGRELDTVRLSALRGKVVVLNVWASWCLACRDEHAALQFIGKRYRDTSDVAFIGLLYNDTPASGRRWIQEMGGQSYPSVLDPGSRTAIDYGVYGVPETFFIAPDGRVAYKHLGPVTPDLLVQKIESLRPHSASGASTSGGGGGGTP
jgi:cytochrome c biogenesis protein CcmG/thiol:disulfide interchange protein DsbE